MGLIVFDARNVRIEPSGIGRVAENLIRHIAEIDYENEYLLIQRPALREPIVSDPRFRVIHLPYEIASLRNYFCFGGVLQRYRPAVYHSLHSFLPFGVPRTVKTVVTVHDFNWIQRPSIAGPRPWRGWVSGLHGRPMHAYTVRVADHVVCISEQTKKDLFQLYPNTTTPVSVIHNGVDPAEFCTGDIRSQIRRYGDTRFILSVGSGRPSKNPEGTLRAFTLIKREPRHADLQLLMVGKIDTLPQLQASVRKCGIVRDVDFVGMVSDAELAFLMRHALLLSFPSLWEGFGLPVIEAFAFGCPVIASNVASLKEIAAGAAWMINDPASAEEIAAAMRTIINNRSVRERLRGEGLKRAASFTWEKAARAYVDIYNQLITARCAKSAKRFLLNDKRCFFDSGKDVARFQILTGNEKLGQYTHKDAKDLITGAMFNFLGMFVRVSKVLFVFVVAKFYGVTALGLYFLAWSVIDILSKFGLWGMDKSLVRDIARFNSDRSPQTNQRIFNTIYFNVKVALILSLLVTAILFFVSPWIATMIFKDTDLVKPIQFLSFAIPFVVLTQVLIATTKGLRLMQYEVLVRQGIEPLFLLIGAIALMPLRLGATGLALAHLMASFLAAVSSLIIVLRKYRYLGWHPKPLDKQIKMETLRYVYPIAAMDFLNLLVARTDIMLVGALLSSTWAGSYGIAVEIISNIKRVHQGLEPIFAPIVSELFYNGQGERLRRNYVLVTRWLMAGSFLPVAAMVIFPDQILTFFDVHSSQASAALMVLALAYGLLGMFSAAESLLVMTGRTLLNTILEAIMLAVNFTVGYFLIPELGLVGAALGTLTSFAVVSVARIYQSYKRLHLSPFSLSLFWPIGNLMVTATIFYLLNIWLKIDTNIKTIAVFGLMTLVYGAIFLMGPTEPEEKHLIASFKSKIRRITTGPRISFN